MPTLAAAKETVLLDQIISVASSMKSELTNISIITSTISELDFDPVTKLIFEVSFRYDFSHGIFLTN